jgi:hypothetical protein
LFSLLGALLAYPLSHMQNQFDQVVSTHPSAHYPNYTHQSRNSRDEDSK